MEGEVEDNQDQDDVDKICRTGTWRGLAVDILVWGDKRESFSQQGAAWGRLVNKLDEFKLTFFLDVLINTIYMSYNYILIILWTMKKISFKQSLSKTIGNVKHSILIL